MTQHIKNYRIATFLLIVFLNISCKKDIVVNDMSTVNNNKRIQKDSVVRIADTVNKNKQSIKSNRISWIFNKVVAISNTYSCESKKYEDFRFSISNDSIFIDDIYTDDVYRGVIKAENYFSQKYLYNVYKTILPKKFNVSLPQSIENIRNKKAYQKESKLEGFFQDAFFVDNFMFFENGGCIYCFKKEEKKIISSSAITLPVSKKEISNDNYPFALSESKLFIDGSLATGEYKLKEDVYILWLDGDIERWYIVTLTNDTINQKLLIGKSETIELKNGEKQDNFIDFFIDKELTIKLEYSFGKNYELKKINKIENYYVTIDKKIIKY